MTDTNTVTIGHPATKSCVGWFCPYWYTTLLHISNSEAIRYHTANSHCSIVAVLWCMTSDPKCTGVLHYTESNKSSDSLNRALYSTLLCCLSTPTNRKWDCVTRLQQVTRGQHLFSSRRICWLATTGWLSNFCHNNLVTTRTVASH